MSAETDRSSVLGWVAVGLSTLVACFRGFWGGIEAFRGGWLERTLGGRLLGVVWWTDMEAGPDTAYRVACNEMVVALSKRLRMGSQDFRAVKDVPLPLGHEPDPSEPQANHKADDGQHQ